MAFINTPSQILASAEALEVEFERLAADVAASTIGGEFKQQFAIFADSWGAFYAEIRDGVSGYIDRLWGGTQEAIDSYRTDLIGWQTRFAQEGGKVTGPAVQAPIAGFDFGDLKWIVAGAVVIVAIVYLAPKVRAP